MNNLENLINQTRLQLVLVFGCQSLLTAGVVVAGFWFDWSYYLFIPIAIASFVISLAAAVMLSANKVTKPSRLIQQALLHLSPTEHGEQAPDLAKVKYGRELLTTLVGQIYQLANLADGQNGQAQSQQNSLKNDFMATNMPLPAIVLDAKENVVFINAAAIAYLKLNEQDTLGQSVYSVLDMSFTSENTFDNWLKQVKNTTVTASSSWERVRIGQAGEASPQFDLAAYYNQNNSRGYETMLILFDHTRQYSQDDQAVSFIALAVHELRTPLTLLRGYIETFEDELGGKLDGEMQVFMHRMAAAAEQLAAFVNNILDVARVEDDQLTLQLHEEDWSNVVQTAVDNYTLRAKVRGIKLDTKIASGLPTAAADRVSVYEIIGNLIDNAIKYSGKSDKIIIKSGLTKDGLIETTIQDFGVGIPTSVIPNLFTKFYRNHRNRSQIGGTGLGLYLCKALVTAHGGNIWVRSEEGDGTTFGFTILPYSQLAEERKAGNNKDIVRNAHGWIKNHSMYRS